MWGAAKARQATGAGDLFARIGLFLAEQRLGPEPVNYAFAHALLSGADPVLSAEVARLTDGGVRLSGADVERLGMTGGTPPPPPERRPADPAERAATVLAAQTEAQVEGFAGMVRDIRHETMGFGRDLARSVAALDGARGIGPSDVVKLAGTMIRRVRESEERLAKATDEAEALRDKLADARATARQDPLTGLANRLGFAEAFAACGGRGPHCLAVCDVDRFKAINDRHGHVVGDRVLRAIAETLAEVCGGHLVARHGGEEFAVLLCDMPIADAAALVDEARRAVGARRFRNRDTDAAIGRVTFSAGITALRRDESADDAFDRADRLLYAAKAAGRDRTFAE